MLGGMGSGVGWEVMDKLKTGKYLLKQIHFFIFIFLYFIFSIFQTLFLLFFFPATYYPISQLQSFILFYLVHLDLQYIMIHLVLYLLYLCFLMCWRRQWHPIPVLLPGKSHGRRSLVGCSPWGHWGSDMTEWLHFHFSLSCMGEGIGNPLQYSCIENSMEREAQWVTIHWVAKSWTQLSD